HPIVRDYFYYGSKSADLRTFHKFAGNYYLDLFKKARDARSELDPELLGEAIHHFLSAGEREKVKSFGLYRYELRPVALTHYRRREYDLALKDYQLLEELEPNDDDVQFHLALIYGRQKKWDHAEEHFGKAVRLKPN